jgi:anaerobic magnesium-protoporphyrin IX monomethyl ester cyclase
MIGTQIASALRATSIIRASAPDVPLVWGGWHPSILPEQTARHQSVDFLVRGQGEETFYELVKALEGGGGFEHILGLTYKRDGIVVTNPPRPAIDPNTFSRLPYHLIDMERFISTSEFGQRSINYLSSIGCPYQCGFCAEQVVYHRRWMPLSADRVVNDLEYLRRTYNIDSIMLSDSNFFVDEQRVVDICKGLKGRGLRLRWGQVNGRTDQLSRFKESTWELMRDTGLHSILTGAETYDEGVLKIINKGATIEDTVRFAGIAKTYGVIVKFSMMIGLPVERRGRTIEDEFRETVEFIEMMYRQNARNVPLFFVYTPFPGSPLYQRAIDLGFEEPKCLDEWGEFSLLNFKNPWVPRRIASKVHQLNYYFPFISGAAKDVIRRLPFMARAVLAPIDMLLCALLRTRVRLRYFSMPIEYFLLRKVFSSRDT